MGQGDPRGQHPAAVSMTSAPPIFHRSRSARACFDHIDAALAHPPTAVTRGLDPRVSLRDALYVHKRDGIGPRACLRSASLDARSRVNPTSGTSPAMTEYVARSELR